MATDNTKAVKELLEIINNKVGKIEMRQSLQTTQLSLMKDQQSVMNEKLDNISSDVDGLKKDVKELSENVDAARGDIELQIQGKKKLVYRFSSSAGEWSYI